MVFKILKWFACLLALALLLCACTPSAPDLGEETDTDATTGSGAETTAEETSAEETTAEETSSEDAVTDDRFAGLDLPEWKKAYLRVMDNASSDAEREYNRSCTYALVYVDDNDVPELYRYGAFEAGGDRVYSYQNGQLEELILSRNGGGSFVERSGKILNHNGHMGISYDVVYQLGANGFTQILYAQEYERVESFDGRDYTFTYEYTVNGVTASKEAYDTAVAAAFDSSRATRLSSLAISYDEICEQILAFE